MTERVERYIAAGGVVRSGQRIMLLRWSSRDEIRLPKGHVEPGETVRDAALRETTEESGYMDLEIEADLGSQRVAFDEEDRPDEPRRVIRTERYFLMRLAGEPGEPRGEGESKFEPFWLGWDEALELLTFEAEREWVRRARRLAAPSEDG